MFTNQVTLNQLTSTSLPCAENYRKKPLLLHSLCFLHVFHVRRMRAFNNHKTRKTRTNKSNNKAEIKSTRKINLATPWRAKNLLHGWLLIVFRGFGNG
jgi:hypothetical protein